MLLLMLLPLKLKEIFFFNGLQNIQLGKLLPYGMTSKFCTIMPLSVLTGLNLYIVVHIQGISRGYSRGTVSQVFPSTAWHV